MPLTLPNLDDRTYADLVEEARSLIPTYAPEWTNHNPSDPGITLIELFAYLSEMLMYRLNRVTEVQVETFLKLINGPTWVRSKQKTLAEEIRETALGLRQSDRAVTCEDFETLAVAADPGVARAQCVPRRDLAPEDAGSRKMERTGHVSVVIVPKDKESSSDQIKDLIARVTEYLDERRLLTTRLHVVGPRYVQVGVKASLVLRADATEAVRESAVNACLRFLDPLVGGEEGTGWPFGRNVYVSEICNLLDRLPGVDYLKDEDFRLTVGAAQSARLERNSLGDLVAVQIGPDELVDPRVTPDDIKVELPWRSSRE